MWGEVSALWCGKRQHDAGMNMLRILDTTVRTRTTIASKIVDWCFLIPGQSELLKEHSNHGKINYLAILCKVVRLDMTRELSLANLRVCRATAREVG